MPTAKPANAARTPSSRSRRWTLNVMAAALPIALIVAIEVALRVAGVGFNPHFFVKRTINGRELLTENPRFGWRFFPRAMARTPEPAALTPHKSAGSIRIVVFGESAAMGDPEPAVGLPRMLMAQLEAAFPKQRFEVINVAMTAINSHVIREIAKDCTELEADFWLIYAGNNEVVGPYGGGTIFGAQAPPLWAIRLITWAKGTRIGQLVTTSQSGPAEWEGMEMFLKQQVPHGDARLEKVHAYFERNIRDIVQLGRSAGARVVVSTVAVNLRDCPPFASQHASAFPRAQEALFDSQLTNATRLWRAGQFADAAASLRAAEAMATNDTHAELQYHLGQCALALGSNAEAFARFNRAKEYDTLRFRADDAENAAVRAVASDQGTLLDAARALATEATNGIPGTEHFYEHVHLTFAGNYALARLFAEQIALQQWPKVKPVWPTAQQCAARLAWNEWKQREVYAEVQKRLQQPPFTHQFGAVERERFWEQQVSALENRLTPPILGALETNYNAVLREHPDDWVIREDHAKLLTELGRIDAALAEWREVASRLPHDPMPLFHIADLSDRLRRSDDAIGSFRAALKINPELVEARNGLGLALAATGRTAEAIRELRSAVKARPRFTQARVNLGQLLANTGYSAEAREQYEAVLKIEPRNTAAHVNLGKLLSSAGDKRAAADHYVAALRASPNNPVAHFNLGNVLAAEAPAEALSHYKAAVLGDPSFAEARYALGMLMAAQGDLTGALEQFNEFVKLRPDSADGHFNYGVALAKTRQFAPAVTQFRETLRLRPDDARAREFLEKASAMAGR